jgi:NTE family protein
MKDSEKPTYGLVLSGGGARGAYEAGVLHYIRTQMPPEVSRNINFRVICGSSVGAINAVFMAATAHDLRYQGQQIHRLWKNLRQQDIYKRGMAGGASLVWRSLAAVMRKLFTKEMGQQSPRLDDRKRFRGILDTAPFAPFLNQHVPWNQITLNINNGLLDALSVTATNSFTGKLELFTEKSHRIRYSGRYVMHDTKIKADHILASAALPLMFPSVKVGSQYYMDGGLRSNTPLSPALHFGADKILVIGMHDKEESPENKEGVVKSDLAAPAHPPSMGRILGKVLSSLFLDKLDYDLSQLQRINRLIDWCEGCYGDDFREKIQEYIQKTGENVDEFGVEHHQLKRLEVKTIFPSRDLRRVFAECFHSGDFFRQSLTRFERGVLKILDVDLDSSKDFLSFILFHPEYIEKLLSLGYDDAHRKRDELIQFFSQT